MQDKYTPAEVERAAHSHWTARDAYRVTEDAGKKKFYACSMLPYPSGKLHMGHVRNYTINDMLTRYLRMNGHNVLMPMGWDAFGLPAENAALKNGVPPAQWTYDNIAYMKKQMQAMGLAIDWSREVATCDPDYYKWNQWLFLKMLEKGIAYRKTQVVNWDPVDQTVLANEQVIDGRGWRTGALVEKREIPGYYLKITDYAQELLDHVQVGNPNATLTGWPDKVRLMQENWIGKSEGVRFAFTHDIRGEDGQPIGDGRMYVFTTRADTIMGVTFCAVAPEHPLAAHAARSNPDVAAFIQECKTGGTTEAELATQEKKGVRTGLTVTHPLTDEPIEVWVGNYVLMGYGDGAVMGVPAHDERDFAFALKYGIEIKQVVLVDGETFDYHRWQDWYGDKQNGVTINSDNFSGLSYQEAVSAVAHALQEKGLGEKKTTWRLRDWGVSRQRYWGTPIPIIHCDEHGAVPVPEKDLPVVLPQDCIPDGSGNPLHKHEGFHAGVKCPVCGKAARRETDTMDTFVDSSWYFMRYCDPKNADAMVAGGADYWMPMDQYIGGIEHAILHLLYARFWTKVMRDLGLVKVDEPFTKLLTQGMVLNHIYSRRTDKGGKEYFWPHDVEHIQDEAGKITGARLKNAVGDLPAGTPIDYEGVGTMSKSKNNGVDPQELIEKYGADTARLYTMFTAPPEATLEWNDAAVEGSYRFLRRVWNFGVKLAGIDAAATEAAIQGAQSLQDVQFGKEAKALRLEIHTVLKQVDYDYQRMQYNTVVSGAMKMLNALEDFKSADAPGGLVALIEGFGILLRVLYPATPHIAHGLWSGLGYAGSLGDLLDAPWPQVDAGALMQDEIELVLQINGKLRGAIRVPSGADKAEIERIALASEDFHKHAAGAAPKKVVVVPGRLVNVVV
ncbi:leucine--tRNA ligase [Paracidovorax citrulli]|uniref:Leucine--tRNA ligase n=2 Tax=Paracidovorax citrulli TaxID=80869 RepID=SYL_PARC0|nr:leucine--tRNA ligase [Paracidovorax citrulli]A1TVU7.1 RecName: Full=Leucine--tRNA ligase; AltName: Full=Leucyl-tRNA synthetase; Short=LeuRS [Paracidovorax citrulli AAC00-1]ABM35085.1 leucyl-tRNA synthetase [Paracidovorax citrulli AAC00-1]ATG96390.1 leucine--tRNA ligase [Paracidovorax citrulli]PVY64535.1 leucyl-tRNA synthetase [Paracidovorax citrulli]REG71266.1 leucyl-tRNA synthetase [Paracidovorax citrulli]RLJ95819.1 leucyl-tRNA synthetase [Paracidovorax citrulli]